MIYRELFDQASRDEGTGRPLPAGLAPYGDDILFAPHEMQPLPDRIAEVRAHGVITLLNRGDVQRYVAGRLTNGPPVADDKAAE